MSYPLFLPPKNFNFTTFIYLMELGLYVLARCNEHTPVYPDVVLLLVTDVLSLTHIRNPKTNIRCISTSQPSTPIISQALAGKIPSTSSTYYCWNKKPEVDEELPYEVMELLAKSLSFICYCSYSVM